MTEQPNREVAVLNAALELLPAERAAYLDEACAGDAALRQQVEELLRAHIAAEGFLEAPPRGLGGTRIMRVTAPLTEKPGDKIGHYKLLQQIGEGGCGVVYMAEQEAPVRRRVALKVIKLGMDTKQVIARFDAERQALALMDHPNIAKIFDAGVTGSSHSQLSTLNSQLPLGRPYFVMELVRGVKITDFCDENKLSTQERLKLFVQVCQAIQHAHQKGIIHRDIKPSNILVTVNDGVPVPKVIDFGIAKATAGRLTDHTLFTAFEQFIGTPAYMSPEQAVMTSLDIDTRSDIYSLGVLLYELLTGKTPFDANELLKAGLDEMRRTIREIEPPKPSTRLSTMLDVERTTTAQHRQTELPKLIHLIRGDLDWIVMKSLEKDRARRYETANGLAADIQRHLANEPVIACPPSGFYRFRKSLRRNRLAFVTAGIVAASLLAGIGVSTFSYITARNNLIRAFAAERAEAGMRKQAETARAGETKARSNAEERLYDSLLGQARATRQAQRVGYRAATFALLRQARALRVPQQNPAELRQEAMAAMGDFIGMMPTSWEEFPNHTWNNRMEISPNGAVAAFGLSDGTILLRAWPSGTDMTSLTNEGELTSFCFNVGGSQIMALHTPRNDGGIAMVEKATLSTWTAGAGSEWDRTASVPFPGGMRCLSSSNGLFVAACDPKSPWASVWRLVDVRTKETVLRFKCRLIDESHNFPHLATSRNGKFLAVSLFDHDFTVELWDLSTHQHLHTFQPDIGMFASVDFSPDSKYLACLGKSGCAVYAMDDLQPANILREDFVWPNSNSSWPGQASFAPGSAVLALPTLQRCRLRLWDFEQNREVAVLEEPEASRAVAFSPDGSFLLTSSGWRARLYQLSHTPEKVGLHVRDPGPAVFSPDGTRIALVSGNPSSGGMQTLRVCDAVTARRLWQSPLAKGSLNVVYSPDGRTLVTAGLSGIQFWDDHSGKLLLEVGTNQIQLATGFLQFTTDGRRLLAGRRSAAGSQVGIWTYDRHDADGSLEVKLLAWVGTELERTEYSGALDAFVSDDRHVVRGTYVYNPYRGKVYVCDLDEARPPRLLATNVNVAGSQIWTLSHDKKRLLVVSAAREVVTLDMATGKRLSAFPIGPRQTEQTDWIGNLSLSPDGTRLAAAESTDREVGIYDPRTGRFLYSLPEQTGTVISLGWSANSRQLVVSRSNGEAAIWDISKIEQTLARLDLSP